MWGEFYCIFEVIHVRYLFSVESDNGLIEWQSPKIYSGKKASVRRAARLTTHAGDAGASPRRASVLAAVKALEDSASAPDGGVELSASRR